MKWETPKEDNVVFILFQNEETNKYFTASLQEFRKSIKYNIQLTQKL